MNTDFSTNLTTRSDLTDPLQLPNSLSGKSILYAVLNWGLGHASRSIPIINELLKMNCKLYLASDGEALLLLKKEFPQLEFIELPSYCISYGKSIWSIVIKNSSNVLWAIIKEHRALKKILQKRRPDIIISDSRFGFYNKKIPSYIISHQLHIPIQNRLLNTFVNLINTVLLNKFNEVWIPDDKNTLLSGKMSKNTKVKSKRFLGIRSRLSREPRNLHYDLAVLLSGPEPSRSILEEKIIQLLNTSKQKIALVRGSTLDSRIKSPSNWKVLDLASGKEMNGILNCSDLVLSRCGYSSILDYYCLGIPAYLIPTPGQSEQEYLAEHLDGKLGFKSIKESILDDLIMKGSSLDLTQLNK